MARPDCGVLQVHLTRHCNLACKHCYSTSGPEHKGSLLLPRTLYADAIALGYGVISLSGGEPLMHPRLKDEVIEAKTAGMVVNMVTNGMLVTPELARWAAEELGTVAVSLDGPPHVHDALRGRAGAFDLALRGLRLLVDAGANCAVLHTATTESLPHLREFVGLVAETGASVMQVHPLEIVGRARETMVSMDAGDLPSRAALLCRLIERDLPIEIHVDAVSRDEIARLLDGVSAGTVTSVLPTPLVIEPDGWVVPWSYGVPRQLGLGRLDGRSLEYLARTFVAERQQKLREHLRSTASRIMDGPQWPYVNWFAELARSDAGNQAERPPRSV